MKISDKCELTPKLKLKLSNENFGLSKQRSFITSVIESSMCYLCWLKTGSRFVGYAKILFDNFWHTPRDNSLKQLTLLLVA